MIARIRRQYRQQVDRDARTVHAAPDHRVVDGDGWRMIGGDFRDVLTEVERGSVDMIVTHPPYPQESLPLWSDLGQLAARVLVPGGILAALTGQYWLPDVMARLREHLAYGWTYCQPLPGASARVMSRHVGQTWKPWLCFTNGPWPSGRVDWHPDTLAPDPRAKGRYTWEQQVGPARQLVERLSPHGGLVLDPMCGVATYGVAALAAGRRFVGTEADAGRFDQSVERLHGAETNPDSAT